MAQRYPATFVVASASAMSAASCRTRSVVAPVELADPERRAVPAQDPPRPDNVRAEIDERPDDAPLAHGRHDLGLVEAVLERDDVPARRQPGRDRLHRVAGVVRLHRQQHMVELGREVVGRHGRDPHGVLLNRPLDGEAVAVDRVDVIRVGVADEDVMTVADERGGDRAADRAATDDDVRHCTVPAEPAARPFSDVRSRITSIRRPVVRMWSVMSSRAARGLPARSASSSARC